MITVVLTISPPAINCETVVPDNPRPCPPLGLFHTSNYERQPEPVSEIPQQFPCSSTQILPPVAPSRSLMLPASREDWNKADTYFRDNLVPSVVEASSAEVKNDLLTRGIHDYFAEQYGTREQQQRNVSQQKRKKHDRALKKVTELKKIAKKEFQEAKRKGFPQEEIILARLWTHSL